MKKITGFLIILTLITIILFAGCTGDDDDEEASIEEEDLHGHWTATSETISGTETEDLKNYTITFNPDGTYSSISKDYENSGKWELKGDKIIFKDADTGETEIEGTATLEGTTLTIRYVVLAVIVVVYEKD